MHDSFKDTVAEVLNATDIVEVVGGWLELKPSGGSRFKALCPFHNEKTPSFTVTRDRQAYYCFGCEKSGDAITFLREHGGLSFREALEQLADRAGIRLPEFTGRDRGQDDERSQLLAFGKCAGRFYRDTLQDPMKGAAGRQYLQGRKLGEETVAQFRLGYAPDEWNVLRDHGLKEGFDERILEASGMIKRGERGRAYDFFRNRLMFPIRDVSGNVVAFGGRDLGDSPAKYINSPETMIYKKGRVLYGLHEARDAMRSAKRAFLVEGYFDVLRCVDAGIQNVVATCGTALTAEQAALIRRYVPEVLLVFDGDPAGVQAALKGVGILVAAGLGVRSLVLPDGLDPDDFIRERGVDAFLAAAEEAPDFVTFYTRMNEARTQSIEGRTEVARELFAIFVGIDDELRRDEYLKHMARELGLDAYRCRTEFDRYLRAGAQRTRAGAAREPSETAALVKALAVNPYDRAFVAILMHSDSLLTKTREDLATVELLPGPLREVLDALFEGADGLSRLQSDEARSLYAAASAMEDVGMEAAESHVHKRILSVRKAALRSEAAQLQEAIENAQRAKDESRVVELLTKKVGIEQEIQRVGAA